MTAITREDKLRALRALKHIGVTVGSERWPTPQDVIAGSKEAQANILHKARSDLVRKYRANPTSWPDGIHSKSDPWYKPEEWDDQGRWIASYEPPWKGVNAKPEAAPKAEASNPVAQALAKALVNTLVDVKPVNTQPVHTQPVNTQPVNTVNSSVNTQPSAQERRKAYRREWMRAKRAELTLTQSSTSP